MLYRARRIPVGRVALFVAFAALCPSCTRPAPYDRQEKTISVSAGPGSTATAPATAFGGAASSVEPVPTGQIAPGDAQPDGRCSSGMRYVEGGNYARRMVRVVMIASLCVDQLEVTAGQYDECMTRGSCPSLAVPSEKGCNLRKVGRERHPMNCIPWAAADAYCHSRGTRLPTTHELFWAAQGGPEATMFPWGSEEPDDTTACWHRVGPGRDLGTCEVGSRSKDRTRQGVYDLAGNVTEWTSEHAKRSYEMTVATASFVTSVPKDLFGDVSSSEMGSELVDSVGFRCVREAKAARGDGGQEERVVRCVAKEDDVLTFLWSLPESEAQKRYARARGRSLRDIRVTIEDSPRPGCHASKLSPLVCDWSLLVQGPLFSARYLVDPARKQINMVDAVSYQEWCNEHRAKFAQWWPDGVDCAGVLARAAREISTDGGDCLPSP